MEDVKPILKAAADAAAAAAAATASSAGHDEHGKLFAGCIIIRRIQYM